jgi:hypothetical protein
MTPAQFRQLALSLPEAVESSHVNRPDFRVDGRIYATLAGGDEWGMVKLKPEQQTAFAQSHPEVFEIFQNGWGRLGCTKVILRKATKAVVAPALVAAWQNIAEGPNRRAKRSVKKRARGRGRSS